MTLVLTLLSRHAVLQVSDRLVSVGRKPRYPAANKNVLFLARDGLVTIGYSGLARIDGVSTDDWIVRRLVGKPDWDGDKGPPWFSHRKLPQWLDVGQASRLLQDEFSAAFSRLPRPTREIAHTLAIAGWQWKWRGVRARPIYLLLNKPWGDAPFSLSSHIPRHWYAPDFVLTTVPFRTPLSQEEILGVIDRLRPSLAAPDACEAILVDAVRSAASRRPNVIGRHCMSILIQPPRARSRFIPFGPESTPRGFPPPFDQPHLQTSVFVGPANPRSCESLAGPAAYTPWIVLADGLLVSHSIAQGTYGPFKYSWGQFEVDVEGSV